MNAFGIKTWALAAVVVLAAELARCAESGDNPLLGRWLVKRAGARDATTLPMKIEWEFTRDQVIVRDATSSREVSRNAYTLDLTKDPKWITVTVVDQVTEVRPGIFRIVGGELNMKQAVGGGARPTTFIKDGYTVMKRVGQPDGAANGSLPVVH
jgi:uncharacterized protein (TIGR03067 family)